MRILNTSTTNPAEIRDALTRTVSLADPEKEAVVRAILDDVRIGIEIVPHDDYFFILSLPV